MFLCVVFLAGFIIKYIKYIEESNEQKNFDYSEQDSLFNYYRTDQDSLSESIILSDKKVDYEQELLDFSENDLSPKKGKVALIDGEVININSADSQTLSRLPGIGIKTAEKIIELRLRKQRYSSVDELIEVKGIGKTKLNNIKKFIIVE